jgi:hypothetical protein
VCNSKSKKSSLEADNIEMKIFVTNEEKPKDLVVTCPNLMAPKVNVQRKVF